LAARVHTIYNTQTHGFLPIKVFIDKNIPVLQLDCINTGPCIILHALLLIVDLTMYIVCQKYSATYL